MAVSSTNTVRLNINTNRAPFSNVDFRRAMSLALNRAEIVQGAFLFAYDLVAYMAHSLHWTRKRDGLYRQLQFNGTSLSYRF
mgnify:CR=1 FL=1